MAHFFIDETLTALAVGDGVTLGGPEGRHAATVSRLRAGERVTLGNGRGLTAAVVVQSVTKDSVVFEIEQVQQVSAPEHAFVLAQALAKSDRDERAVEAAVELGVDAVVPFAAARSVSRWDAAKEAKGRARWQSIAREAAKQSLRAWVPEVRALASCRDLIALTATRLLVLDAAGVSPHDVDWSNSTSPDVRETVFVVGPEGGFGPEERDAFGAAGATFVRLGSNVLRTSTAGPVALGIASALSGRWA
jgi:16S rRNA (uracil1498-N3)-methyltransferase